MFSKITDETSFAAWTLRRARIGVTNIVINYAGSDDLPVIVYVSARAGNARGFGATEAEAMDDAFARLTARIGASFCEPTEDSP